MATAIDSAGIQFRTLNASKGPAVRATRAQADRQLYRRAIREVIGQQPNLTVVQHSVDDLIVEREDRYRVSSRPVMIVFLPRRSY